jgi:hypothetical protein
MKHKRKDLSIDESGKINVNPDKIQSMKERIKQEITPQDMERLLDQIIDEELEYRVYDIVLDEISEKLRGDVRRMLSEIR